MDTTMAEVTTKRREKAAQLQFQLEDDVNLPELKPDLEVVVAWKWNVSIGRIKAGNGKVCAEGEVEYLILYSREDYPGRLEVLSGSLPFNQCILMDRATEEGLKTSIRITGEQVKKRNNRKLSLVLTMEMEATCDGSKTLEFVEDIIEEDAEKLPGELDTVQFVHEGTEVAEFKEVISLPGNRPDIGRVLMDRVSVRGMELRMEEEKLILRGEAFVFVIYESAEEHAGIQFLEYTVLLEREMDSGFCREDLFAEYEYRCKNAKVTAGPNEDGEERELALHLEIELNYEMKQKVTVPYLEDAYSLKHPFRPVKDEMEFERARMSHMRRVRIGELFAPPAEEKILQTYVIATRVAFAEAEVVDEGVLVEGEVLAEILYITASPSAPPSISKVHLPFHQLFEEKGIQKDAKVRLTGDVVNLSVNILDSTQAEIKGSVNLTLWVSEIEKKWMIKDIEGKETETKNHRLAGMIGYIVGPTDTLWEIAKDNDTTMDDICKINGRSDKILKVGEKIVICRNQ